MSNGDPLVSVVVPAFNAAHTIQETLTSVSQQTYRALEVIVVDDGSTDETAQIARRHSLADPRFRVVSKPNGGVASARNEGFRVSKGAFVAFVDADDLWHPTKIAKQLKTLLSAGPETALVYSPFRAITADGKVFASPHKYGVSGWVLHRHFHSNIVGNGSSFLIRRTVLEEMGGFDPWLREQGAEGCEDLLLQLRIARRYQFGEVPEYLVGYRRFAGNMSSNADQMVRSGLLAVSKALSECSDVPGLSADAMLRRYEWKRLKIGIRKGRARDSLYALARLAAGSPAFVAGAIWTDFLRLANKLIDVARGLLPWLRSADDAPRYFHEFDPRAGVDPNHDTPTSRALRRLAKKDVTYRPRDRPAADRSARPSPDGHPEASAMAAFAPGKLDCSST